MTSRPDTPCFALARGARRFAVAAMLAGALACASGEEPHGATTGAPVGHLAEATTTAGDLRVTILTVERIADAMLEVRLAFTNPASARGAFVVTDEFASHPADAGSLADLYVIDAGATRKHFVIRDAQDRPACSTGIEPIAPGETRQLWARFLAPPAGVTWIGIQIPRVASALEVALAGSPPAR